MSERYGFEAFDCAPALRLEAHERVAKLQFDSLNKRLDRIEELIERLDRRLWLTVYGVVGVILAQAFGSLLQMPMGG
ncbi:MAG: GTA head formation protein, RCAP_rcc01685 family [Cognatishimia sp.]|uniref:GTA head formation protein, RCAP_rcc01685 family n=1 Tax=Cognatishimia sp. TaxID=2211648 RepID=UPI00405953B8